MNKASILLVGVGIVGAFHIVDGRITDKYQVHTCGINQGCHCEVV